MTTSGTDPRYDALAELALGTLPEAERPAIQAWLDGDPAAQAELRALRESLGLLAMTAPDAEPSEALRARVLAIAGPTAAKGVVGSAGALRSQAPARSGVATGWLAAAAAALVALGLGWYAMQLRSEVERLEADLQVAETRLANTEAEARTVRTRLARAQAETAILSAADLRRVDLAGQKGGAAGHGACVLEPGAGAGLHRIPVAGVARRTHLPVVGADLRRAGQRRPVPARRVGRHVDGVRHAGLPAFAGRPGRIGGARGRRAGSHG